MAIEDEFTALNMSRQEKWQLRRQRDGLCRTCGKGPLVNRQFCAIHAKTAVILTAKYVKRHPDKVHARLILSKALWKGEITRGLCHCGKSGEAHHADYSKPLEVTWLCKKHHSVWHSAIKRREKAIWAIRRMFQLDKSVSDMNALKEEIDKLIASR